MATAIGISYMGWDLYVRELKYPVRADRNVTFEFHTESFKADVSTTAAYGRIFRRTKINFYGACNAESGISVAVLLHLLPQKIAVSTRHTRRFTWRRPLGAVTRRPFLYFQELSAYFRSTPSRPD